MKETRSTETTTADPRMAAEPDGHGRHRGPVSVHDEDAAPRGRHRKPADGADLS